MLRRAVQQRPYDCEPLLSPVLQAYSTVSESTGFTPFRVVFGREMRLPIDFGSPLPEPPRDIKTLEVELTDDYEMVYKLANKTIGHELRKAENRYNERVVEKLYSHGSLVRVIQHTHPTGVPSKLNPKNSGLCEVLEVCNPILTLRERDTQRIFTANHNSVRASSLSQPDAEPDHASHDFQTSIPVSNNSEINLPDVSQNQSVDMSILVFNSGPNRCHNHESIPRSIRCSIFKSLRHRNS